MVQEEQDEVVNKEPVRSWRPSQGTRQDRVGCLGDVIRKRKTCALNLGAEVVRVRAGFGGLATKPSEEGFSVWASKPIPRAQRDGDGIRARREASRRRLRGAIGELASRGRGARCECGRSMVKTKMPLRGVYLPFMH